MNKLLVLSALALFSFKGTQQTDAYICVSPNAKKYHFSRSCSGLQKCTHTIKKTTVAEAKKIGYTICLLED
jgi:hypothetical protein